jgi:hypothetical protein
MEVLQTSNDVMDFKSLLLNIDEAIKQEEASSLAQRPNRPAEIMYQHPC